MLLANNLKKELKPPTKNDKSELENSFSFCLTFKILWLQSKSRTEPQDTWSHKLGNHVCCFKPSNFAVVYLVVLDSLHSRSKVRHENFCISNTLPGKIDFMLLNIILLPGRFSLLQPCTKPLLTLPFCLNPITPFIPNIKWFPLPAM